MNEKESNENFVRKSDYDTRQFTFVFNSLTNSFKLEINGVCFSLELTGNIFPFT